MHTHMTTFVKRALYDPFRDVAPASIAVMQYRSVRRAC
jgi:hypothetical protein